MGAPGAVMVTTSSVLTGSAAVVVGVAVVTVSTTASVVVVGIVVSTGTGKLLLVMTSGTTGSSVVEEISIWIECVLVVFTNFKETGRQIDALSKPAGSLASVENVLIFQRKWPETMWGQ